MSSFITRMRAYRERLSITQSELAEKVGVRRETILRLEKGQYNPSLKLAFDISSELDASVEELFIFNDNPPKDRICYVISADTSTEPGKRRIEIFAICDNIHDTHQISEEIRKQGLIPEINEMVANQLTQMKQPGS